MPISETVDAVLNHGADLDASRLKLMHHPYHDEVDPG